MVLDAAEYLWSRMYQSTCQAVTSAESFGRFLKGHLEKKSPF